ncbi:MAG: YbhB/YbcL family Raf kinase inhibitor-like protein [Thermodesulfobacteriota bacterium]
MLVAGFAVKGVNGDGAMAFGIKSPDFKEGQRIPVKFTCEGEDLSPELVWEGPPEGTKSYTLIVEDPDAPMGTFIHWVVYDVPPHLQKLERGIGGGGGLEGPVKQGVSSFGNTGYGGPCPPKGHGDHRYFFILRALDVENLGVGAGAEKADVERAMEGHILGEVSIMGKYSR